MRLVTSLIVENMSLNSIFPDKLNFLQRFLRSNQTIYSVVLLGGLGNRLFQVAAIYALSRSHGTKFSLFPEYINHNPHSDKSYEMFYGDFIYDDAPEFVKEVEPDFEFGIFRNLPRMRENTLFHGYFQSEKYFKSYEDEIRSMFGPSPLQESAILDRLGNLTGTAFLHVRLGDYLSDEKYLIPLNDYYQECLVDLEKNAKPERILIASDDETKCKVMYPFLSEYEYIKCPDEIETLHTMTLCGCGGICTNSSFSWWGAWLNNSSRKRIYMPSTWIKDTRYKWDDIFIDGAIRVAIGKNTN